MFATKGEFIQSLKDINSYDDIIGKYQLQLEEIDYILYDKMRSPLDYDIIGYNGKEAERMLKTHSYISEADRLEARDILLKKRDDIIQKMSYITERYSETMGLLETMDERLQNILKDKFINGLTYTQVANKYDFLYYVEVIRYIQKSLDNYIK